MPTPVAVLSGGTRGFELGMFKKGPIAQGFNFPLNTNYTWWNGVDILSTQYLIYTDKYTMGSSTLANTIPVAWSTPDLNDSSLLALINTLPPRVGLPGFTDLDAALNWMDGTGDFFLLKNGIENIVTSNLQLYWDAGWYTSYVGSGTLVNDLTANNFDGTLLNSVGFNSSGVAAFSFDGSDDAITGGDVCEVTTGEFSIEAWVRLNALGTFQVVMQKGNPGVGVQTGYRMRIADTGMIEFVITSTSAQETQINSNSNLVAGQWYHIHCSRSGTNMKIYINGVLSTNGTGTSGSIDAGSAQFYVGRQDGGSWPFNGLISSVKFYDVQLTPDQVLQNYNAQKDRFGITSYVTNDLVLNLSGYNSSSYPRSGTSWFDLSGYGNVGSLANGTGFLSDNGGVLNFDGADDYVDLGYKPSLLNSDITQEAWVNADSFTNWHGIISNMSTWGTGFSLQIGIIQNIAAMISGNYLTTSWTPSTGVWYHIVATHRSSDDLNVLYVNGIQQNSAIIPITYQNNAVTRIGVFYTSPGLFLDGKIGVVRSYKRALEYSEVIQNFEAERSIYGVTGVTTSGLVLWLDAGNNQSYPSQGTTWYDISGSMYDGALINGPTFSTDGAGSIIFDGTNDYVMVSNDANILSNTSYTKIAWFNPSTFSLSNNIISGGNDGQHAFWLAGGNKLNSGHNGAWSTVVSTTELSLNTWYFGAVTFDTTSGWKLYLNGVQESTNVSTVTFNGNGVIKVGAYNVGNLFGGKIANAIVYNRVLSASEILQNFNAQRGRYGV